MDGAGGRTHILFAADDAVHRKLMIGQFTLAEPSRVYEIAWGTGLDSTNFHRKVRGRKLMACATVPISDGQAHSSVSPRCVRPGRAHSAEALK